MADSIDPFQINDPSSILSPGLVFFRDQIERNTAEMIRIAGGPERLRPHAKTHKTREIIQMQLGMGITRHKCATIAEAEMLAETGVPDLLIAYQMVGPNIQRLVQLSDKYPQTRFATLIDDLCALESLASAIQPNGREIDVLLDLDPGMHRTGIQPGPEAIQLYEAVDAADEVQPGGLHWYDGHHRQPDVNERTAAVDAGWNLLTRFRDQLMLSGLPIPQIVAAGTGSFPILAEKGEPNLQLSPGTTTLYDADMKERFPELPFEPAAGILTRVVSVNRSNHLTLDVGHKSCGADQPAGKRLWFPALPDAVEVKQNEEHLVVQTGLADQYELGSHLIAIPRHVCPTSAVHDYANIISGGDLVDRWEIVARTRQLTI